MTLRLLTFMCRRFRTHYLFHLYRSSTRPIKMEQIECSETSAHKIQTQGNHPKERIQQYILFHVIFLNDNKRNDLPPTLIVGKHREENRLDATECFIVLIICSTCFGHLHAHHQELDTTWYTCVIAAHGV